MPSSQPSLAEQKKRKISVFRRILTWYLGLRLLNKLALWMLVASIPIALVGYHFLRPVYRHWKQKNALSLASACIQKNDDKGAFLAFKRAIIADPKTPEVWEKLGAYLESKKSSDALWVWDRLTQLQPTVANRYRVARAALSAGDWRRARNNLDAVPEGDRVSQDYLLLSSQAFAAAGQQEKAETAMKELLHREPDNAEAAFNLDKLQSESRDPAVKGAALVRMRALAEGKGPHSTVALRQLALVEAKAGNNVMAASDASALVLRPDAGINDQLLFLELEFMTRSFTLPLSIAKVRELAFKDPANLRPVIIYLIRRGLAAETLAWLEKQPAERLAEPNAAQVHVDLAIAARDWERTYALLGKADPPISPDLLEKIRAAQKAFRSNDPAAMDRWGETVTAAHDNLYLLGIMEQLAAAWDWPEGREKVLWTISDAVPGNVQVWRELLPITLRSGNTPALLRILSALTALDASNQQLRSMWLSVQFLLQRGDDEELLKLAEADANSSDAPDAQLIYAVLLAKADKIDQALAVSDKIPASARMNPRTAAYLAYVYAKAKKPDAVKQLLSQIGGSDRQLLGEENALAERARAIAEGRKENELPTALSTAADKKAAERVLKNLESRTMDEGAAQRLLKGLEGERTNPEANRQRLLEQLKSQGSEATGASEQLKRLRQEIQKDPLPAATPFKK